MNNQRPVSAPPRLARVRVVFVPMVEASMSYNYINWSILFLFDNVQVVVLPVYDLFRFQQQSVPGQIPNPSLVVDPARRPSQYKRILLTVLDTVL